VIELISFVFFKLLAILAMFVLWGWPPVVALFFWSGADEMFSNDWSVKTWQTICIVFGFLGTVTYWAAMVPGAAPNDPREAPADALYHFTLRGMTEQAKRDEATKPPTRTELGTVLRRYRLDGWNPPKHFYVDLTDLETGQKHERLYVSKHCNSSGSLKRGEEYNIVLNKYSLSNQPGVVHFEFTNLYGTFC
jgi:hypothetical protein